MAFTSVDGKIDLSFPKNTNAFLKLKSDNGEIYTDEVLRFKKRKMQRQASPDTGLHEVYMEDYALGVLNNGGSEILCRTYNGNIYIRCFKKSE